MIGRTLAHYRVLEKLGEGGMGQVFLAEDLRLHRQIALKVLPAALSADPDRLHRFEREARAVAALNHPNIVTLHSIEEFEGVRFLTMELVRGRTLSAEIRDSGLELTRLLQFAVPLADALAAVHAQGITHRDLKPANVMVCDDGRVKILDFGLARLRPDLAAAESFETRTAMVTTEGVVLGTAPYLSPEQVEGKPVDHRSDIFSLGVVLYEMATGHRPFRGATAPEVMSAILREPVPPVDAFRSDLPAELGRVIRRCLEKDPARRYQSALDVRNELDDLLTETRSHPGSRRHEDAKSDAGPRRHEDTKGHEGAKTRRWRLAVALGSGALVTLVLLGAWNADRLRTWLRSAPPTPAIQSIAVLPFQNMMNDPAQDYFVDGMHEALITNLAKVKSVRVISRTSVMGYRNTDKKVPQIAHELGVDAVIEGSVLRAGSTVRITAQLISGVTDQHLWANSYDRPQTDVLALLSDVARAIAGEVAGALTPQQAERLAAKRTVNPAAHELYLKGRYHLNAFTADDCLRAIDLFKQAIAIDSSFAEAHAGLAATYSVQGVFRREVPVPGSAREAAERAVALDDGVALGHAVLGIYNLYVAWDWDRAGRELERAVDLDPTDALARHGYGDYLSVLGRVEEGLEQVILGRQYDPLSAMANGVMVAHLMLSRHYDEARVEAQALRMRFPEQDPGSGLVWIDWIEGRRQDAIAQLRQNVSRNRELIEALDRGLTAAGPHGALRAVAGYYADPAHADGASPLMVAEFLAQAGEIDQAFAWLERAYQRREPFLVHITFSPLYDPLRGDPRFADLLHRMGLPGAQASPAPRP